MDYLKVKVDAEKGLRPLLGVAWTSVKAGESRLV